MGTDLTPMAAAYCGVHELMVRCRDSVDWETYGMATVIHEVYWSGMDQREKVAAITYLFQPKPWSAARTVGEMLGPDYGEPTFLGPSVMDIPASDPRHAAAKRVLEAMHAFWKLNPFGGAVQWIEDTDGHLVVFTRGEKKQAIRQAIAENLQPDQYFELVDEDDE